MRRTVDDLIEIGNALIRQKAQLSHGAFHKWIEAESEMSIRTAQRCMNVASEFGAKYAAPAHLGVMALDMLRRQSPKFKRSSSRVAAGDILSAADVNRIAVH
jgi:hypothetical protein